MKPIQLTMQAFGSYGKKTVIDFTRANRNLFLITGNTGAGKTTIFDAIVFALYGETGSTNNKKDGAELTSQYVAVAEQAKKKIADGNTVQTTLQPFVELTFSELTGGEPQLYTVTRSPHFKRPPKRAGAKSGEIDVKEVVTLTLPDGRVFDGKISETNQKIAEIVGLTQSQFMQIAMIAQGEFMELLRASSDDKKVIFRKLFGTELFPKIVAELKARKDQKQKEMDTIFAACKAEVARVIIPEEALLSLEKSEGKNETDSVKDSNADGDKNDVSEDENNPVTIVEELKEIQKNILASTRLHVPELEQFVKGLQVLCETLENVMQQIKEQEIQAQKERDDTRDALQQATTLQTSFDQLEAAEKTLKSCAAEEKEIADATKLIGEINAAYEVQTVYQRFADAEKLFTETTQKLHARKEDLPKLTDVFVKAGEEEAAAKKIRDAEREVFAKLSERVTNALAVFEKIQNAEKTLQQQQINLKNAETLTEAAKHVLERFEAQEQGWKKQADALADADVLLEQWKAKDDKAKTLLALWQDDAQEYADCRQQKKIADKAEEDYRVARNAYTDKRDEYNRKNIAFLDIQAGFIAKQLQPGKPCPVCGSREHPQPCVLAEEHTELTRKVIDGLAKDVAALEADSSQKAAAARAARGLLDEKMIRLKENLSKLRRKMLEVITDVPETMVLQEAKELIDTWQEQLAKESVALLQNATILATVRKSLQNADAKKLALKNDYEEKLRKETDARTVFAAAEEALKGLVQQKEYASVEETKNVLANAKTERSKKDAAYDWANRELLTAKRAKETAETLIAQFEEALPGQKAERDKRSEAYEKILQEKAAIFADTEVFAQNEFAEQQVHTVQKETAERNWQTVIVQYCKEDVIALQQKINAYKEKYIAAQSAAKMAKQTIAGRAKPKLIALQDAATAAEATLAAIQAASQKIQAVSEKNTETCETLAHHLKENGKAGNEYGRITLLYERFNGKQKDARMDIETFVQRYYLQRILYAANRRFREMSAGQFELRMTGEGQAGQGKNRGLDLMVYSVVTGKEREIRTLSGGESFMAALSLALGMADQIQESSAAINLDVMFIDEGFGSLDEHSRSQAVRVLKQMAGGSRLIGIISHVSELKQEIEDQLLVTKDEHGSHTRWQIS